MTAWYAVGADNRHTRPQRAAEKLAGRAPADVASNSAALPPPPPRPPPPSGA